MKAKTLPAPLPETTGEALTDAIVAPAQIHEVTHEGRTIPVALLPEGWSEKRLDGLFPKAAPTYREGNVRLDDLDSFCHYVSRHKTGATVIYATQADSGGGIITAVLDDGEPNMPGRRVDRAYVALKTDPRFSAWLGIQGKAIAQKAFIDFIREHDRDFFYPTGSQMRSAVNSLELKKSCSFKNIERESGAAGVELVYVTDTQVQGTVAFPEEFDISVPLLRFCPPVTIRGRILFDVNDGVMTFCVRLQDLHVLTEGAWKSAIAAVKEQLTDVPVLNGAP